MSNDWKYGDVVRRAVTTNPLVYQYLMYVCPGKDASTFTSVRLSQHNDITISEPGHFSRITGREYFELAPEDWDLPF